MARDAKSSQRILAVQRQLRRMQEVKLAELEGRVAEIKGEQISLISAMNEDGALQSLFLDTMARRMDSLAEQLPRAQAAVDVQVVAVRAEATKEKAAERIANSRIAEERAHAAQKELDEVLELLAHPRDASLR